MCDMMSSIVEVKMMLDSICVADSWLYMLDWDGELSS